MSASPACMCAHHMYVQCPLRSEEVIGCSGVLSCERPCDTESQVVVLCKEPRVPLSRSLQTPQLSVYKKLSSKPNKEDKKAQVVQNKLFKMGGICA